MAEWSDEEIAAAEAAVAQKMTYDVWTWRDLAERALSAVPRVPESLSAKLAERDVEIARLQLTMSAEGARMIAAAEKAGFPFWGCDTPDALADEIIRLKSEIARLTASIATARNNALREAAEALRNAASWVPDPMAKTVMYADANFILDLKQ